VLALCEKTFASHETDVEGVIEAAMGIDNSLIDFYREVAEHATSERVREAFQNLIAMEESDLRHLALSALQIRDI
jgi:rubrerythrin